MVGPGDDRGDKGRAAPVGEVLESVRCPALRASNTVSFMLGRESAVKDPITAWRETLSSQGRTKGGGEEETSGRWEVSARCAGDGR